MATPENLTDEQLAIISRDYLENLQDAFLLFSHGIELRTKYPETAIFAKTGRKHLEKLLTIPPLHARR